VVQVVRFEQFELLALTFVFGDRPAPNQGLECAFLHGFRNVKLLLLSQVKYGRPLRARKRRIQTLPKRLKFNQSLHVSFVWFGAHWHSWCQQNSHTIRPQCQQSLRLVVGWQHFSQIILKGRDENRPVFDYYNLPVRGDVVYRCMPR
jgi:hypothetical protein